MKEYTTQPTENSQIPDPDQVLYEDKTDAEQAATARGCSGTHSHEVDGRTHHMACDSHQQYHGGDSGGSDPTSGAGSYVDTIFDLTTAVDGGTDTSTGTGTDSGTSSSSNFLRPRSGAPSVEFGRDRDTGEFDATGGDPVPLERNDDGEFAPDPFAVGNFGQFNSPYDTTDEEEDKYG